MVASSSLDPVVPLGVPGLRLRLLGSFQCAVDGRPVPGVWYDKMRALLAYLAVQPAHDHRREALAELLWSSSDPVTARGNLRRTLSDLRRVLEAPMGRPVFDATKHTIRFLAEADVDALQFGAHATQMPAHDTAQQCREQAATLYQGEFMAGFHLPDCPPFEDWLLVQRESLHRRALALLEQLANVDERLGRLGPALQFALRHVELDPWDEAAHRRVMRLHALSGQPGAALAQFDACCRELKKELGLAPSADTRALAERIRLGDVAAALANPAPTRGPPIPPPIPSARAQRRHVSVLFC